VAVQTLDIISVNIWQIIISLINLLILFLILKKFLFKPVQKIMDTRRAQVQKMYSDAESDKADAGKMKQEYEQRLTTAREEADTLVKNAVATAQRKGEQTLNDARNEAARLKQKAEKEIEQQKKQMISGVVSDISDLAVGIASKIVEREIDQKDYDAFVDDFIRNVGDQK